MKKMLVAVALALLGCPSVAVAQSAEETVTFLIVNLEPGTTIKGCGGKPVFRYKKLSEAPLHLKTEPEVENEVAEDLT